MLDEIALWCRISKTSIQHIASVKDKVPENRRQFGGRKKKLTPEQEVLILRSILELRDKECSFSSWWLMEHTGICHVTDRTVRCLLNRNSYFFLQACKKRLLSQADKDLRVEFARKMQAEYSLSVWTDSVAFYLGGVSFVYKTNPLDQACAPEGRLWRKRSEGLTQGCLAKGSKSRMGEKWPSS